MEHIKESLIKIDGSNVMYNGDTYNVYDFIKEVDVKKNAMILLIGSNIYIKKFQIDSKDMNDERINKIKETEFGKDNEYLIDYKINRKVDVVYMYAVCGGKIVSCIADKLNNVIVVPIQMLVFKYLNRKVKEEKYRCLFFYLNVYYYFDVCDGYIDRCYIWNDINDFYDFFERIDNSSILYVQRGINVEKNNAVSIDLGGLYNEKIFD